MASSKPVKKRGREETLFEHKIFDLLDYSAINFYKRHQYLHLRPITVSDNKPRHLNTLVFESFINFIDKYPRTFEAFQTDNKGSLSKDLNANEVYTNSLLLSKGSWYTSAILQTDPISEDGKQLTKFIQLLPIVTPPCFKNIEDIDYDNAIWLFCGKREKEFGTYEERLLGRSEHTDSVECSGTWHYQLLGEKIWRLRPDIENIEWDGREPQLENIIGDTCDIYASFDNEIPRIFIRCIQGDVLILNTKLWLHQTEIPVLMKKFPSEDFIDDEAALLSADLETTKTMHEISPLRHYIFGNENAHMKMHKIA